MTRGMRGSLHSFRLRRDSLSLSRAGRTRSALLAHSPEQSSPASHLAHSAQGAHKRGVPPACDRCRSFKKKCSRTFPECTLCVSAGRRCSYSTAPLTLEAEVLQLRARVHWLSEFINNNLCPVDYSESVIENIETGSDLASIFSGELFITRNVTKSPGLQLQRQGISDPTASPSFECHEGVSSQAAYSGSSPSSLGQSGTNVLNENIHPSPQEPSGVGSTNSHVSYRSATSTNPASNGPARTQGLSGDTSGRRFVDAFFRNTNNAYPFINQSKILEGLETFGDLAQRLRDSQSTLLYLVMSIGCTSLERAGEVPRDTSKKFDVAYADVIQECVCRDSIESVQILMLLALYSLFDPTGPSTFSIVGIAARQAVAIGLTRRPSDEYSYPPSEIELRHRLYWSIFALDRLTSVAQGLPVALTDDNSDVPFPGLTVEEFTSPERSTHARKLQTSRHIIMLRQLESRVLSQIHLRKQSEIAELAPSDRKAMLTSLRASIDDWYSQGCLMSPMESDHPTVHSSSAWLSARYYHLLLLLYYPNHFNSSAGVATRQQILQFAQRQLQFTSALFQRRQLPLNSNTLQRLMPICMVLMQDFMATYMAQPIFSVQTGDDVGTMLAILEGFPEGWEFAQRAARVMRQFSGIISGGEAFFSDHAVSQQDATKDDPTSGNTRNSVAGVGKETILAMTRPCIADLILVIQGMLGQSTCFQFCEYPKEESKQTDDVITIPPYPESWLLGQHNHQRTGNQCLSFNEVSPMFGNNNEPNEIQQGDLGRQQIESYGWGALDIEFM